MVGYNILKKLLDIYKRKSLSCIDYLRWRGVKIGENCNIHSYDFGSEPYLIELGDHVQITRDVLFFTHGGKAIYIDQSFHLRCICIFMYAYISFMIAIPENSKRLLWQNFTYYL